MELFSNVSMLISILGIAAFAVSVITEVLKNIPVFKKVSTELQVLVTSVIISVVGVCVYVDLQNAKYIWYYFVGSIILGIFISFVSMYGWEKLSGIYSRFNKK